jgi:6,7-dimethyl-8-ribityllumazine synthase
MASELKNLSNYSETGIIRQSTDNEMTIGIVVSEWNQEVTASLTQAAIETLKKYGFTDNNIIIKSVPGSFELPQAAKFLIDYSYVNAVICLGCVIQGETRHFDFVCFGILTTQNLQQALDRSGGKHGNKGVEAAIAALKMIQFKTDLSYFNEK